MSRIVAALVCLVSLLTASGCAKDTGALNAHSKTTLTAGRGLGDLRLGETTLDWFIRHVGTGRKAIAAADNDAGFEFIFKSGQISFLFLVEGQCHRETSATRRLVPAVNDLEGFLTQHPGCREVPLHSISVAAGPTSASTFFKGSTDKGASLWLPITASYGHGTLVTRPDRLVAGLSANDPPHRITYSDGIAFYYEAGTSGKLEDTVIKRITIFRTGK